VTKTVAELRGRPTLTPRNKRRSVAVKISTVARLLRVTFDHDAEKNGLTRAQWHLIGAVSRHPGVTQRTIAEALEVREITAGRLVDRLCEEGYLRREENPSDRRAYCVYLTPSAQPLLDKLDELAKVHEGLIFAGFQSEELEKLDELLDKVATNLIDFRQQHQHRVVAK
jgi:MarR family transcriptional regulator, transcriptional regulator for hemolysin